MITPIANKPAVFGEHNGEAWSLTVPEGFYLSNAAYHFPTASESGPVYPGVGDWEGGGDAWRQKRVYQNPGVEVITTIVKRGGFLDCSMIIKNTSNFAWDEWSHINNCYKPFLLDPSGGGMTYVMRNGVPATVGSLIAIPQSGPLAGQFGMWVNRQGSDPNNCLDRMLARRNPANTKATAVGCDRTAQVGGNFLQSACMHANPKIGLLGIDQRTTISFVIALDAQNLDAAIAAARIL